jgi:hypothetical protein
VRRLAIRRADPKSYVVSGRLGKRHVLKIIATTWPFQVRLGDAVMCHAAHSLVVSASCLRREFDRRDACTTKVRRKIGRGWGCAAAGRGAERSRRDGALARPRNGGLGVLAVAVDRRLGGAQGQAAEGGPVFFADVGVDFDGAGVEAVAAAFFGAGDPVLVAGFDVEVGGGTAGEPAR